MDTEPQAIFMDIENTLRDKPGVTSVHMNSPLCIAKVSYDPSVTGPRDILNTFKDLGFDDASLATKKKRDMMIGHSHEIKQYVLNANRRTVKSRIKETGFLSLA